MAYLVRQRKTYYVDASGKRVPKGTRGAKKVTEKSRRWYGVGIPGQPPRKRIPLATDREAAKRLLTDLVRAAERGEVWVPDRDASRQPLKEHLADFERDLALGLATKATRRRQPSPEQVVLVVQRVRDSLDGCGLKQPSDLNSDAPGKLARFLTGQIGKISAQTANFYLAAVRRFTRWIAAKRVPVRPDLFDSLPGFDAANNRVHARREFSPEELCRLIDTTRASKRKHRWLTGEDRAMLYLVAFSTGYRASELAELTPECFDLDGAAAMLPGKLTKNKKRARQPLPPGIVHQLSEYLPTKSAGKVVWPGKWRDAPVRMLRLDLDDAKIPYRVESIDGPRFADFHSLRHSYLSALAAAGAGIKELQVLARHSDPKLTLGVYTHARPEALVESVRLLPIPGEASASPLATMNRSELEAAVIALAAIVGLVLDTPGDTPPEGSREMASRSGEEETRSGDADADPRKRLRNKGRSA